MDYSRKQREGGMHGNVRMQEKLNLGAWRRSENSRMTWKIQKVEDSSMPGNSQQQGYKEPGKTRRLPDSRLSEKYMDMSGQREAREARFPDSRLPGKYMDMVGQPELREGRRVPDSRLPGTYEDIVEQRDLRFQKNQRFTDSRLGEEKRFQQDMSFHQADGMEEFTRHPGARMEGDSKMFFSMPVEEKLQNRTDTNVNDLKQRSTSNFDNSLKKPNMQINMQQERLHLLQGIDQGQLGISAMLLSLTNDLDLPKKELSNVRQQNFTEMAVQHNSSGDRPMGSQCQLQRDKSSKAFDYLKSWRLKMNMPTDSFMLEGEGLPSSQQQNTATVAHASASSDFNSQAVSRVAKPNIPDMGFSNTSYAEKKTFEERPDKFAQAKSDVYTNTMTHSLGSKYVNMQAAGMVVPPWKLGGNETASQNPISSNNNSPSYGQAAENIHCSYPYQPDMALVKRAKFSPTVQFDREHNLNSFKPNIVQQDFVPQRQVSIPTDISQFNAQISTTYDSSLYPQEDRKRSPYSHNKELCNSPTRFNSLAKTLQHIRAPMNISHQINSLELPSNPEGKRSPRHLQKGMSPGQHRHKITPGSVSKGQPPQHERLRSASPFSREKSKRSYPRVHSPKSVGTKNFSSSLVRERYHPVTKIKSRSPIGRGKPNSHSGSFGSSRHRVSPRPEPRSRSPEMKYHRKSVKPSTMGKRSPGPITQRTFNNTGERGRIPRSSRFSSPIPVSRKKSPRSYTEHIISPVGRSHEPSARGRSPELFSQTKSQRPTRSSTPPRLLRTRTASRSRSRTPRLFSRSSKPNSRSLMLRTKSPRLHSRSPRLRTRSPRLHSRSPRLHSRSPKSFTRSTRPLSRSPKPLSKYPRPASRTLRLLSRSPRSFSRSPRPFSRSPRLHSRYPRLRSSSPKLRSRSPRPPMRSKPHSRSSHQSERSQRPHARSSSVDHKKNSSMGRNISPYLEDISLSPKSNREWSPLLSNSPLPAVTSSERSLSLESLQIGCSPISLKSMDYCEDSNNLSKNLPNDPAKSMSRQLQSPSPSLHRGCSPVSPVAYSQSESYDSTMKARHDIPGGSSGQKSDKCKSDNIDSVHHSKGTKKKSAVEKSMDQSARKIKVERAQYLDDEKSSPITRSVKDANIKEKKERLEKNKSKKEESDEDLRLHLLRLREQKVELRLKKLEEESIETEYKLWELKKKKSEHRDKSSEEIGGKLRRDDGSSYRSRRGHF